MKLKSAFNCASCYSEKSLNYNTELGVRVCCNCGASKEGKYFGQAAIDANIREVDEHIVATREQAPWPPNQKGSLVDQMKKRQEKTQKEKEAEDAFFADAPIVTNSRGGQQSEKKYRMDLVPPQALLRVAYVLWYGAKRYPENNWRKLSQAEHLNSMEVHIQQLKAGDVGEDHAGHLATRALFFLEQYMEDEMAGCIHDYRKER